KLNGVSEATWRATPTDGLGIDAGDEAQLGASYLEWDLMVLAMGDPNFRLRIPTHDRHIGVTNHENKVHDAVRSRMGASWFKRMNPVNLRHHHHDRYEIINRLDRELFHPAVV